MGPRGIEQGGSFARQGRGRGERARPAGREEGVVCAERGWKDGGLQGSLPLRPSMAVPQLKRRSIPVTDLHGISSVADLLGGVCQPDGPKRATEQMMQPCRCNHVAPTGASPLRLRCCDITTIAATIMPPWPCRPAMKKRTGKKSARCAPPETKHKPSINTHTSLLSSPTLPLRNSKPIQRLRCSSLLFV